MNLNATTTTGLISADGVGYAQPCRLHTVILTAAAATATLIVYDNASAASGTVLASVTCVANTSVVVPITPGVCANLGLYADIGGAGATAVLHFAPGS